MPDTDIAEAVRDDRDSDYGSAILFALQFKPNLFAGFVDYDARVAHRAARRWRNRTARRSRAINRGRP